MGGVLGHESFWLRSCNWLNKWANGSHIFQLLIIDLSLIIYFKAEKSLNTYRLRQLLFLRHVLAFICSNLEQLLSCLHHVLFRDQIHVRNSLSIFTNILHILMVISSSFFEALDHVLVKFVPLVHCLFISIAHYSLFNLILGIFFIQAFLDL